MQQVLYWAHHPARPLFANAAAAAAAACRTVQPAQSPLLHLCDSTMCSPFMGRCLPLQSMSCVGGLSSHALLRPSRSCMRPFAACSRSRGLLLCYPSHHLASFLSLFLHGYDDQACFRAGLLWFGRAGCPRFWRAGFWHVAPWKREACACWHSQVGLQLQGTEAFCSVSLSLCTVWPPISGANGSPVV
jgi:hypothetical protein